MKLFILLLFCFPVLAQNDANTEVFLFDINKENQKIIIENGENISQNLGYDNQPSFYSRDTLIFSKTRKNQTDITGISLKDSNSFWINNSNVGSEYSPQRIPGTMDIAAVRLDTTGLQLLYKYNWKTGVSSVLVPQLKVGYFAFLNKERLIAAVLNDTAMDLMLYDLGKDTSKLLVNNVGRSIHKVPGIHSMSYTVVNENKNLDLYILDLKGEEPKSYFLVALPIGTQDYAWLDENRILLGSGSKLFLYDILGESEWTVIADLSEYQLENITRVAVNTDATKLALAADLLTIQE
tara:strand:- start:135090 stop:135971 length:882 start_codon:yes stop_codon:yes gene_type:complete